MSEDATELGYAPEFLDSIRLSETSAENILLRSFAAHIWAEPPEGMLPRFLLWHLTMNVRECSKFTMIADGQQGLVRYMRDGHFPVEPEETFASWRRFLRMEVPIFHYWSCICCYVTDEGVERMVRNTWHWPGDIGSQMYASLREFVCNLYKALMQSPFDHTNGLTMLLSYYAIMYKALGCFDRKTIIKGGSLKPVAVPLSRNACRERVRDRREKEFQRIEHEAATSSAVGTAVTATTATVDREDSMSDIHEEEVFDDNE